MTQPAINNARVLYELSITRECIEAAEVLYGSEPLLKEVLTNKTIPFHKKERIIDRVFQQEPFEKNFRNFLKVICNYGEIDELEDSFQAFYKYWDMQHNILRASVISANDLNSDEIQEIQAFLERKYPDKKVVLSIRKEPNILGGTLIRVGYEEYDFSYECRLKQLERKLIGR